MHALLKDNLSGIVKLCKKYHVNKLYVFGSVLTGRFSIHDSDIDLYVELLPLPAMERGQTLIDLWDQLESLLDRKIDLVTDQPVRNPYFLSELEKTKQIIYDREKQKILI
jgi:hypothetical protein